MDYKKKIEEIFSPLIFKLKLFVELKSENSFELFNSNCIICIDIHFGEVYVRIKKNNTDECGITPYLWAIFTEQINFKKMNVMEFAENQKMSEMVISQLQTEYTLIRLFCGKLVEGDFSSKNDYLKTKDSIIREINEYYELKNKN